MKHIMLTNDDGVHAPGLKMLFEHIQKLGKTTIIAPEHDNSAASHSLTSVVLPKPAGAEMRVSLRCKPACSRSTSSSAVPTMQDVSMSSRVTNRSSSGSTQQLCPA